MTKILAHGYSSESTFKDIFKEQILLFKDYTWDQYILIFEKKMNVRGENNEERQ